MFGQQFRDFFPHFAIVLVMILSIGGIAGPAGARGNFNCDASTDLKDVVTVLQVAAGMTPDPFCMDDATGDDKAGLADAVYLLREAAGLNPSRTARISGQVTGSGGLPDVVVRSGGASARTDANGYYLLEDVRIPDTGRVLLTYEKTGYATYQRSIQAAPGNSYAVSAKLNVYAINEMSVDQTAPPTLEARNDQGDLMVSLDLPDDGLEGAAPGNVKVSVSIGDPSTEEGRSAFPGDYMAAPAADQTPDTPLESVAFTEITIRDADDKEITQLKEPADITIRLPEEFQTGGTKAGTYVPDDPEKGVIAWWSYNETAGTWLREDADADPGNGVQDAEVVAIGGVLYARGKVTHFTWWNADVPLSEHACICVMVTDENGDPRQGIEVTADGVSYNGASNPALTDGNGRACVNVKRTTDNGNPETVNIIAKAGNARFPFAGNPVAVWDTQGSTLANAGDCMELPGEPIRMAFDGVVQGTVTKQGSGETVPDFMVYTDIGPTAVTNASGYYEMEVPTGIDFLVFAPGLTSRKARVEDPNIPVILNLEIPNRAPVIDALTRDPEGKVDAGDSVAFSASAHDEDGDPIQYQWTATEGTLSPDDENTTTWTAPSSGAGTAVITLTVSDDRSGQTDEVRSVLWGGEVQGTSLKFTIKDTPVNNQAMADVYVILHGTDGKTVDRFIETTADGIADFGDIGRDRATVTLAYIEETANQYYNETSRTIETYVDVLVGDIVYYIDDSIGDAYCQTSDIAINARLAWDGGVPDDLGWVSFSPVSGVFSEDNVNFNSIMVCPEHIQDDGKISILSQAYGEGEQQELFRYGFVTDQDLVNNGTYDIAMSRTPLEATWSTEPATPMQGVFIDGTRKGVDYSFMGSHEETPATFGILPVPNEFPMDGYWVTAYSGYESADNTSLTTRKKYDAIPQYMEIPVPDLAFDAVSYDPATRTFSWNLSGTADRDIVSVSFYQDDSYEENGVYHHISTYWDASMDPDSSQWTLADLPAEIASWLDLQQINEYTVSAFETDVFSGFDSMWYAYINGVDPELESHRMFSASRNGFSPDGLKKRALDKPSSAEDTRKPYSRKPLKGLNRN